MDYSGVKAYLRVKPSVSVRRISFMIFHKEHYASSKIPRSFGRFKQAAFPVIEAASGNPRHTAQDDYRKILG